MNQQNSKLKKISNFDPSAIGIKDRNIFGLPFTSEESEVVIIPMPWEVTVSYRAGTAHGPATMHDASYQVDLYDSALPDAWKAGISMEPISKAWMKKNMLLRKKAEQCIRHLENGGQPTDAKIKKLYTEINNAGQELNTYIQQESLAWLKKGKAVAIMGGEHSVPLGYMKALTQIHKNYSMLHIDAHADLREAYEGFEFSHASIQYNATKIKQIDQFVLVGIRDYSEQEANRIKNSKGRIVAFTDRRIKHQGYKGKTWHQIAQEIIKPLSEKVYISFDIDALDPSLCPHTGTPVPGGLEFEQVMYLAEQLIASGRTIIGFDLCEVAPKVKGNQLMDDWDSVVGVRALYRLCNLMAKSQGKL